jgi:hypothetical protein
VVALVEVEEAFRVGERDLLVELNVAAEAMVSELIGRIRSGKITKRNLNSQRRSVFGGAKSARTAIAKVAQRIARVGVGHVVAELERQS